MTLVDSSSWVEALRPTGNPVVRGRVLSLLDGGDARWCDMVRLELWRGVRAGAERKVLDHFEKNLKSLDTPAAVWENAVKLMIKARGAGLTAPAADVLIVATAAFHAVALEHCDQHLERLLKLM